MEMAQELCNRMAEPSPTTGTFSMPLTMHDPVSSDTFSSPRDATNNNSTCDEGSSGEFEFKPHARIGSATNLSSVGHLASAPVNYQQNKPFVQAQGQNQSQMFPSASSVLMKNADISSHGLTLSVTASNLPTYTTPMKPAAPSEITSDESQQRHDSDRGTQMMQLDHKGPSTVATNEKSSEDGYNWRKYGQKLVKGSEFPRSYYKCTHPNCQVKKQLERSYDGHVTEIIYKGTHDHPKPQPGRRLMVGLMVSSQGEERSDGFSSLVNAEDKTSNAHGQTLHQMDPNVTPELSPISASDDDIEGAAVRSNKTGDDVDDDDDPESKRRRMENGGIDVTAIGKPIREPRVVVQTLSEVDILDDGYRWRKYGQKVVKGNPNPRSYYKCTNAGCPVRKHVERASHDPKAVITTYEGKHNHDVPSARTSSHDSAGPTSSNDANSLQNHLPAAMNGLLRAEDAVRVMVPQPYDQSRESDMISLDLGVGIGSNPESRSSEKQQILYAEQMQAQIANTGSGYNKFTQGDTFSSYYGSSKDGSYRPREEQVESFSFKTTPVLNHSSNTYPQNVGSVHEDAAGVSGRVMIGCLVNGG
ncbi:hypothetical protein ACLOJK_035729 [Asimina triloba]